MKSKNTSWGFTATACVALASACLPPAEIKYNENHCANLTGDRWCSDKYRDGEELLFCNWGDPGCEPWGEHGDGCVAERPVRPSCYSPCGQRMTLDDDPLQTCEGYDTTAVDDSSTSSSTSDEESSESTEEGESSSSTTTTTGPADCREEPCTEPGSAFCNEAGECVSCEEASTGDDVCLAFDARIPACNANGECVACTAENLGACEGQTPLCNAEAFTCEGCTWHEQCPADAPSLAAAGCNMVSGACLPSDNVLEVNGDGGGAFFSSITAALGAPGDAATIIVHAGAGPYFENVVITGNRTIALIAAPGEAPRLQGDGAPGLTISGGATVFVQGLRIAGNQNGLGVRINGAGTVAYIDRTHIAGNTQGGIEVTGGATLTLRNSFVQGLADTDAIHVTGSTVSLLYASAATQAGTFGGTQALVCETSTVTVRNSLFVAANSDPDVDCPGAAISNSASETLLDGTDNIALGNVQPTWFEGFVSGDLRLNEPPADLLSAALWEPGFPPFDIDGDPRPYGKSNRDVAGADVPSP